MKKILFLVLALIVAIPMFAEERPIKVEQLPSKVVTFINNYFEGTTITLAQVENRASLTQYEVKLSDGTDLQFNKSGIWTEIKRKKNAVPASLIPEKIRVFVSATYPDAYIKEIEHDDRLYEIILSNNIEMTFSNSFKLLDIDK